MALSIWNTGKRSLTWCRRRGRWCHCQWENCRATSKTNSNNTIPLKYLVQAMRELMALTVRELQRQHKTNSHGTMLSVQNTGKRSLTWCRQRGRWCSNWRENCSATIKRTLMGLRYPFEIQGKRFDLVQVEREVMPYLVRELQRHHKTNSHGTTLSVWNKEKRSLTWWRRSGRWCPFWWANCSATIK